MANYLTIFCLLDGDAPSQSFSVRAQPTITVDDFKELVKIKNAPRFDAVPARELTLWRVCLPVNNDNEDHPIALNVFEGTKVKLRPTTRLSTVFTEELPEETIHFIVQAPSGKLHLYLNRFCLPGQCCGHKGMFTLLHFSLC